ncbi:hypothetical protein FRC02_001933 [Tulasnella sp. 418]|nr:hypothetical protein FRC02_001933 [Tulasnella sp. 418]
MFRDEDSEEQFQELCWFKAGRTQTRPITPIWNVQLPSGVDSLSRYPELSARTSYEASSMTNLSEQDYSSIGSQSRLSLLSIRTLDVEGPAPPLQRDRERLPRLPQLQEPSDLTLAPFKDAAAAPIESSESDDELISRGEISESDLASVRPPLAWTGSISFRFLDSQSVCTPNLIVACDDWVISGSSDVLLFTLSSMVVLYNTARKTAREIDYGFHVRSTSSVAHSLSPDGKTLVRWVLNEENQASSLLAIDVRSKRQIAKLQQSHKFQQSDLLGARWIEDSTIYIPISAEGIIIAWDILKAVSRNNLHDDKSVQHEDLVVLRPFSTITRHRLLKFEVTKDRAWWIATGTTLSNPPSGLIEVRDVENDESRIIEGMLSCIAEVKISDKEKALLVSAGVTPDFKVG